MFRKAPALLLSESQRHILEAVAASPEIPDRVRKRARIVLKAADGLSNNRIAHELKIGRAAVIQWRERFAAGGIRQLWDANRSAPAKPVPSATEQAIVFETLHHLRALAHMPAPRRSRAWNLKHLGSRSGASLRWNVRNIAEKFHVSPATVQRIWKKHGIAITFRGIDPDALRVSPDPLFPLTVAAVAGLIYSTSPFAPPALVLFTDPLLNSDFQVTTQSVKQSFERFLDALRRVTSVQKRGRIDVTTRETRTAVEAEVISCLGKVGRRQRPPYEMHALTGYESEWGAQFKDWAASHPTVHVHYMPLVSSRHGWTDQVRKWLDLIAAWPARTSLITTVHELTEVLGSLRLDRSAGPVILLETSQVAEVRPAPAPGRRRS